MPAHFTTKNKQISVAKGKQVHVQCNVQGDTPIDIKWKIQSSQQHLDSSTDSRYVERIMLRLMIDGMFQNERKMDAQTLSLSEK